MPTIQIAKKPQGRPLEELVPELLQAERSKQVIESRVVMPFDDIAKTRAQAEVYREDDGLDIRLIRQNRTERMSPGQIFHHLTNYLAMTLERQAQGKQAYGVRDFNGTVAIEADHLAEQLSGWGDMAVGNSVVEFLKYRVTKAGTAAAAKVASTQKGRLALVVDEEPIFEGVPSRSDAELYVTARSQADALDDHIKAIREEIKGIAEYNPAHTTRVTRDFNGYTLEVTTVPQLEPDYTGIVEWANDILDDARHAEAEDVTTFFNTHLKEPKHYIAAEELLGALRERSEVQELKYNHHIHAYHRPDEVLVLVSD